MYIPKLTQLHGQFICDGDWVELTFLCKKCLNSVCIRVSKMDLKLNENIRKKFESAYLCQECEEEETQKFRTKNDIDFNKLNYRRKIDI